MKAPRTDGSITSADREATNVRVRQEMKQRRTRKQLSQASWVTFALGAASQLAFAAAGSGPAIPLTVMSVLMFSSTAVLCAAAVGGWRLAVAIFVIGAGLGLVAEAVGVATGFPFGEYAYTGQLGPGIFGVSALVLLAWLTLAYPSVVVARRLTAHFFPGAPGADGNQGPTRAARTVRIVVAAWALTAWDVFLDPQMVAAGNWGWANPEPSLPGVPGIPITNYLGWFGLSLLMCGLMDWAIDVARKRWDGRAVGVPGRSGPDTVPYTVYLWTYFTCLLGNFTFFERPSVAVAGGIAMGIIAIPLIVVLMRDSRSQLLRRDGIV